MKLLDYLQFSPAAGTGSEPANNLGNLQIKQYLKKKQDKLDKTRRRVTPYPEDKNPAIRGGQIQCPECGHVGSFKIQLMGEPVASCPNCGKKFVPDIDGQGDPRNDPDDQGLTPRGDDDPESDPDTEAFEEEQDDPAQSDYTEPTIARRSMKDPSEPSVLDAPMTPNIGMQGAAKRPLMRLRQTAWNRPIRVRYRR